MDIVHEVMQTFFPEPQQNVLWNTLRRDFDADVTEAVVISGYDYTKEDSSSRSDGDTKAQMMDEEDDDAFSRFDDIVSTVLSEEDQEGNIDEDKDEVFDLQIGTNWSIPPQPKSLLYRKGWGLDGLSPFVHIPGICSTAGEPDNILYNMKQ